MSDEKWEFLEIKPGPLYHPQEILRERRRRDRHRLSILFGLLAYLLVCAIGAAWLAMHAVEAQTLTLLLQAFVISLIPVIILVIREFTRRD